jgi:hypothetical protein
MDSLTTRVVESASKTVEKVKNSKSGKFAIKESPVDVDTIVTSVEPEVSKVVEELKTEVDQVTKMVEDVKSEVLKAVEGIDYSKLLELLKAELEKNPTLVIQDLTKLIATGSSSCVPCTFLQNLLPSRSK